MLYVKHVLVGEYPRAVTMWPLWGLLREKPDWDPRSGVSGAVPKPAPTPIPRGPGSHPASSTGSLLALEKLGGSSSSNWGILFLGAALPPSDLIIPSDIIFILVLNHHLFPKNPLEAEGRG